VHTHASAWPKPSGFMLGEEWLWGNDCFVVVPGARLNSLLPLSPSLSPSDGSFHWVRRDCCPWNVACCRGTTCSDVKFWSDWQTLSCIFSYMYRCNSHPKPSGQGSKFHSASPDPMAQHSTRQSQAGKETRNRHTRETKGRTSMTE
jgi:hypothetical protein